jgi:hypothetical protein
MKKIAIFLIMLLPVFTVIGKDRIAFRGVALGDKITKYTDMNLILSSDDINKSYNNTLSPDPIGKIPVTDITFIAYKDNIHTIRIVADYSIKIPAIFEKAYPQFKCIEKENKYMDEAPNGHYSYIYTYKNYKISIFGSNPETETSETPKGVFIFLTDTAIIKQREDDEFNDSVKSIQ